MLRISLLILLTSCVTPVQRAGVSSLTYYRDLFAASTGCPTPTTLLRYGPTEGHIAAYCERARNRITINPSVWYDLTEYGREELMFHELGHCALHLDHNEDEVARLIIGGSVVIIPASIMYPVVFGDTAAYRTYRTEYIYNLAVAGGCITTEETVP